MKIRGLPDSATRNPWHRISTAGNSATTAMSIGPHIRITSVIVAVATVTALAVLDAVSGARPALAGLIAVGPCLVVASGRPFAVLGVGGYASVLMSVLARWPDQIWGTLHHLLYLLATAAVTLVSFVLARRVQLLELRAEAAEAPPADPRRPRRELR